MSIGICLLPVVPLRKEPSHRSEMVSQLLFGEYADLQQEDDGFTLVRCHFDDYEGWVQTKQLTPVPSGEILTTRQYTTGFTTLIAQNTSSLHVPYASPVYNGGNFSVGQIDHQYLTQPQTYWDVEKGHFSEPILQALYQPYLGAPYLWGGKSVYGTDCSGFVQQVFKLLGYRLRRDAYQQAEEGLAITSVSESRLGDLAFFQNEKGRITHVGIVLSGGKIIHAAGQVRIDSLTEVGIFQSGTGEQSHRLQSIRRII